ncbi:MAG: type VI secretion system tip protein TssI/VgrG [Polyangiaceae bacterium]
MPPRHIDYVLHIAGHALRAHRVQGREALSEPASFAVSATLPVLDALDVDDAAGTGCELVIAVGDGLGASSPVRSVRLVATSVERAASADAQKVGVPLDVVLESPLALARHRVDVRIFRDLDVPTIVERVLSAFGVTVERRLSSTYAVRPYTVQWRESDYAFVSRLLEDEGIYFATADAGGVILGDAPASYTEREPLAYVPRAGLDPSAESITKAGWKGRMTPSRVTMRDFDFERPRLDVTGSANVRARSSASGGEWYQYPAGSSDPRAAASKASFTAEAFLGAQRRLAFTATRPGLATNDALDLGALPAGLTDGRFAVVALAHDWDVTNTDFHLRAEAIDADGAFRPMPSTPRPSLVGATVGTVTGAPGEDIHTDEWGRAKVHFHWDRLQPADDRCSDWIPTLQDNTGHSIGIPRVGWEVMVQHLEGDPDRPVILGRLYTPADAFYSKLPDNRMYTTLRSLTSPRAKAGEGDTGQNLIEFRDLKDNQHMRLHAERDQVVLTEHDRTEVTKERDARDVYGHEAVKVGKSRTHTVEQTIHAMVGADQVTSVGHDRRLTAKKALSENSTGSRKLSIGSTHVRKFGTMDELALESDLDEKIGALNLELCPHGNVSSTKVAEALLVGGAIVELAKAGIAQTAQKLHTEIIGALLHQEAKEHIGLRATKKRVTTAGGDYAVKSGTAVLVSGLRKLRVTAGSVALTAKKKLTLKVQNTTLILDAATHAIDAPEEISAWADARNDLNAARSGQNDRLGG